MNPEAGTTPDVLTVDEAAQILRIGRNSAYALARRWLATGGEEGLPAVRLGRCLRIPRPALEQFLGCELDLGRDGSNIVPFERSRPTGTL